MEKLGVEDLEVSGRRVFVRVDFNLPLDSGRITDDSRIRASLPTIRHLLERRARVVLASHLGRPKSGPSAGLSLRPAAVRLAELLGTEVGFAGDCVGEVAEAQAAALGDGELCLLENLRFHAGEEKNDPELARKLALLAPLYVNDAFGAAHRAHASTEGITHHVERSAAGLLLRREVDGLLRAVERPRRPFLLLLGGAKVADKIEVIEGLLPKIQSLVLGGGMAYTFLRALGVAVGRSRVEEDKIQVAERVLEEAEKRAIDITLPVDHVAAAEPRAGAATRVVESDSFPDDLMGLDIGPITLLRIREIIEEARTIVWNGPMGVFELPEFASGTLEVARAVAASLAYSVVGGGDSVAALHAAGVAERIGHVSTGGGASLELLSGKTLPGVAALSPKSGG